MSMVDEQDPRPDLAATTADFVALMLRLKQRSGSTFRQLEERAAEQGSVLPRSTIADVLRRPALPRPEVLVAFVRACGGGEKEAEAWLRARDRLAAGETQPAPVGDPEIAPPTAGTPTTAPPTTAAPPTGGPPTAGPSAAALAPAPAPAPAPARRRWLFAAVTAVVAVLLVVLGAALILPGRNGRAHRNGTAATTPVAAGASPSSLAVPSAGSWARIKPAGHPLLCLSEGREHTGRYRSAIAAQQPCDNPDLPRTYLRPVGDGLFQIQWHHPVYGDGCLTLLDDGPAKDMFEPQDLDHCGDTRPAQLFTFETVAAPVPDGYRLHTVETGLCVGIQGGPAAQAGAEAVQQSCAGGSDQEFLVDLLPG